jgi:DNA-binding NarL/FixJ family response regulator
MLVEDHAPRLEAVRSPFSSYEDVRIIGEAADGRQAVKMAEAWDMNTPRMNGIEAANLIEKSCELPSSLASVLFKMAIRGGYEGRSVSSTVKDRLNDSASL